MPTILTKEQLDEVADLSSRAAAIKLGVAKTTVNKARAEQLVVEVKGVRHVPIADTKSKKAPATLEQAVQALRDQDVDVSSHELSYGFVERELANGSVTHQYTVRAVARSKSAKAQLDPNELIRAIEGFTYPERENTGTDGTFVICPSDMQIGKTSYNGGTAETIKRVQDSLQKAVDFVSKHNFAEIVIAELGDPLENFTNTSSQRETNDLNMTGQVRVTRRLLLEIIKALAPHAPVIRYVTVPSNHGSVRVGFKAPAGDNHNDWGLEIADQLADAVSENDSLSHVSFHKPDFLHESMSLETSGTVLGFVHGHQSRGAEKIGDWWKGQDHGRGPTANADILLAGHWHSFRAYQSGNARWVFISPASDPGSDWFTNITGEYSQSGMLSFTVKDKVWANLVIL